VEAAAQSGGHYATRSPRELHELYTSAAGGGLITSFTALFKFLFSWAGLAPFWEGFFFSVNYVGSFVAMQVLGFSLASKQPSMTAAHLARAIDERQGASLEPLALEVARVFRSQLAATLGNLGTVIPAAVGLDLLIRLLSGQSLLDPDYATAVVAGHNPFLTALVPGAMATGVALWISSVAAGTLENWAVYRRLPEAVASHRALRSLLGAGRTRALGDRLLRSIGGLGGNLALGLQMGMVPTLATFFGVPLQLHHVSVATGQLAFAGAALGPERIVNTDFGLACLGIVLVGTMNFGVSFALALWVALRARESAAFEVLAVGRSVARLFIARPADFFRAPANDPAPAAPAEVTPAPRTQSSDQTTRVGGS
jgi:site-specific recombinase